MFSRRQHDYRRYRIEGMTIRAAALKAGYSPKTAHAAKLDKACDLQTVIEMSGLTNKRLASEIVDGIEAIKSDGNPDWHNRHKYLETVLKVKGERGFSQEKAQAAVNAVQVNITLPGLPDEPRALSA